MEWQMSESLAAWVQECYRRAKEARRIIEATTTTPAERADFLEVERRWLSLARGHGLELKAQSKKASDAEPSAA
jgi:hypothetical protein